MNDFASNETFATTSSGYTGYVAWDQAYLYVGMSGGDIASGDAKKWFTLYLSGASGTTMGVPYNTQKPTLPFQAKWHVRWKANGLYTNALTWNGTSWVDAAWSFTNDVFQTGNYIEMRIPRANIGSPSSVSFVMDMLNETNGVEATYAGVPMTAFTDGPNPSFAHFYQFDLNGCMPPSAFAPM